MNSSVSQLFCNTSSGQKLFQKRKGFFFEILVGTLYTIYESYIMEVDVKPSVSRSHDASTSNISLNLSGLPRLTVNH